MRRSFWRRFVQWWTGRDQEAVRLAERARVHAVEQDIHGRGF